MFKLSLATYSVRFLNESLEFVYDRVAKLLVGNFTYTFFLSCFNNIPEVKIKKKKFHYIIRKFVNCEEKVIPYSVELSETIGKRKH